MIEKSVAAASSPRVVVEAVRDDESEPLHGWRAEQTRIAILEAAKKLFLDRGYAGTRISNITDACGISRAGFYTYFRDKREVFNVLGRSTYRDMVASIARWDQIAVPASFADVEGWVGEYFDLMDEHGAFVFSSAQSAPTDAEFRESRKRVQTRLGWLLGTALRDRQQTPTDMPEALGLAMLALLDRSWYYSRAQQLPVGDDDMITTVANIIWSVLR